MKNFKMFSVLLTLAIIFSSPISWAKTGDSHISRIIPVSYEVPVENYSSASAETLTAYQSGLHIVDRCGASGSAGVKHILPTAVAGMEFTLTAGGRTGSLGSCTVTLDTATTNDTILYSISGTALDAGDSLKSTGQKGDSITVYSPVANTWVTKDVKGSWTDNGTS